MFSIRYADVSDCEILGEIHSKSWQVAYKNIIPDEVLDNVTPQKRAEFFKKALTEGWEEDAIIFKDDTAAGMISIGKCRDKYVDKSYGEIWGIYLLPQYWNQGIGAKLMEWGIRELKDRGFSQVTLWVLEENINAIKFYEKQGFEFDDTVKEIFIGKNLNECRYVNKII